LLGYIPPRCPHCQLAGPFGPALCISSGVFCHTSIIFGILCKNMFFTSHIHRNQYKFSYPLTKMILSWWEFRLSAKEHVALRKLFCDPGPSSLALNLNSPFVI
jgi:hypothetical protein